MKVHILLRNTGAFDYYSETPIRAYANPGEAEACRERLTTWFEATEPLPTRQTSTPPPEDPTFPVESSLDWDATWRVISIEFVP